MTLKGQKPLPSAYPTELNTLGDWVRKTRLDRGLYQEDVAKIIGVVECCITNWELNHTEPEIGYIPKIIRFIGYCPYTPTQSLTSRLRAVRWALGISHRRLAKIMGIDPASVVEWETGRHQPVRKSVEIIKSFLDSASFLDAKLNDQV